MTTKAEQPTHDDLDRLRRENATLRRAAEDALSSPSGRPVIDAQAVAHAVRRRVADDLVEIMGRAKAFDIADRAGDAALIAVQRLTHADAPRGTYRARVMFPAMTAGGERVYVRTDELVTDDPKVAEASAEPAHLLPAGVVAELLAAGCLVGGP